MDAETERTENAGLKLKSHHHHNHLLTNRQNAVAQTEMANERWGNNTQELVQVRK